MPVTAEPELKSNEPMPPIDVKGMSSKFKKAMGEGAVPPPEPAKAPEPPKAPEPAAKAPEPTPEPKGTIPEPPKKAEPKAPEAPKQPEKIPSTNFKELEASRDEFRKKAEAAEAKAKEIEAKLATAVDPAKITELEAKLEKANKQAEQAQEFVDRFYLEHSPSFKKAYGEKIDAAIADAKEAVPAEVADQIEKVLRRSPSKARDEEIAKLTEEMSDFQRLEVMGSYKELKRLQKERDSELSNSKENVKKLQEYEQKQAEARNAEFAKSIKSTFTQELGAFEVGVDGFKTLEGKEDYNKVVAQNRGRAEDLLASDLQNPTNRARISLWAAYGMHANQLVASQSEKIAKLEKQIADIQGANPSLRGGAGTKSDGEPAKDSKPGDRIVSRWREAQEKGIPPKE